MPKLTQLRHSLRKTAKWGGLAAAVLLCVVWIGSRWWTLSAPSQWGGILIVMQGITGLAWLDESARTDFPQQFEVAGAGANHYGNTVKLYFWRWELARGEDGIYGISFPAWLPLLVTGTITAFAWRSDLLARRRARIGKCIDCGYALDGLPPNTPCPECGRIPKAQSAAAPRTEDGAQGSHSPPR